MDARLGGDPHQAGGLTRFGGYEICESSVQDAVKMRGVLMLCADLMAHHQGKPDAADLVLAYATLARLLLDYNFGCPPGSPSHLRRVKGALMPFQEVLEWACRR